MSNVFVIVKMCYVHNQWYDISCATLYIESFLQMLPWQHSRYPPAANGRQCIQFKTYDTENSVAKTNTHFPSMAWDFTSSRELSFISHRWSELSSHSEMKRPW